MRAIENKGPERICIEVSEKVLLKYGQKCILLDIM
jgi:hypothetical protein